MSTSIPSTYTTEFALPDALPSTLKELTREILREQPDDIDKFALEFFESRLENSSEERRVSNALAGDLEGSVGDNQDWDLAEMSPQEIEELIFGLFKEQDVDGNRTLDRHEFKQVFHKLGQRLGLSDNDVRRILAEADCDGNGDISYSEFVPVAVGIIETIVAKDKLRAAEEEKSKVYQEAELQFSHGMSPEEVDEILTDIFKEADVDGSGALDLEEFERCISDIRIGMTRKEVNVMMFESYSKDGMIDYQAFKPLCIKLLCEMAAAEWISGEQDEKDLQEMVLAKFQEIDPESSGLLSMEMIKAQLLKADLGMSLVQICSIMSEAHEDENGMIDYIVFAPRAAFMIKSCLNYRERLQQKKDMMQTLHASDEWGFVFGKDRPQLEGDLQEAFSALDTAGTGCLSKQEIKTAIKQALGDVERRELNALLALCRPAETPGRFKYSPIVDQAFRAVKGLHEFSILMED